MISNQVLQNTVEGLKEISRTEFSVLDTEGKVLHIQDSSFLEEVKGYDEKKVLRFLKNWTPKAVNQ